MNSQNNYFIKNTMKRPFSGNSEFDPHKSKLIPGDFPDLDQIPSEEKPIILAAPSLGSIPANSGIEIIAPPRDFSNMPPLQGDRMKFTVISKSNIENRLVFKLKVQEIQQRNNSALDSLLEKEREFTVSTKCKWLYEDICEGDLVRVLGTFSPDTYECNLDQYADNIYTGYIILEPDTFLTATLIASGTECMRKAFFDLAFPRAESKIHYPMLLGTMVHETFENSLIRQHKLEDVNEEFLSGRLSEHYIEFSLAYKSAFEESSLEIPKEESKNYVKFDTKSLSSLPEFERNARNELTDYLKNIKTVVSNNFYEKKPLPNTKYMISDIIAIEQKMFSKRFGIKGQTDATVEVQEIGTDNRKIAAIELKSGEINNKLPSHKAQCGLYALLLQELGCQVNDEQFLVYIKFPEIVPFKLSKPDYNDLIEKRNKLVKCQQMVYKGQFELPTIKGMRPSCRFCPHNGFCQLYSKANNIDIEDIDFTEENKENSLENELFTPETVNYFKKWLNLITLEQNTTDKKISSAYPWAPPVETGSKKRTGNSEMAEESWLTMSEFNEYGKDITFNLQKKGEIDIEIPSGTFVDIFCTETPLITLGRGRITQRDYKYEENKRVTVIGISLVDNIMIEIHRKKMPLKSLQEKLWSIRCTTQSNSIYGFMRWALVGLCTSENLKRRRELIIDLKRPSLPEMHFPIDKIIKKYTNYLKTLNSEQIHAIAKCLNCSEYQIVLGVHGSGKSTTIAALLAILSKEGKKVFFTANSHIALDSTLRKLIPYGIKFLRIASNKESVHPDIQSSINTHIQTQCTSNREYLQTISKINIIASTPFSATNDLMKYLTFDYCIVEEASQMIEPVSIGALLSSKKFVLFGDGSQHVPMVGNFQAKLGGYGQSLFDRLSKAYPENVAKLYKNYVMNRGVLEFISSVVYGGMMEFGDSKIRDQKLFLPSRKITYFFMC